MGSWSWTRRRFGSARGWLRRRLWPGSKAGRSSGAPPLAAECEAFLCGRYAEHLSRCGATVPAWAWANILAHGSLDDISSFSQRPFPIDRPEELVGELAARLLTYLQRSGTTLCDLQRTYLEPLERQLYVLFGSLSSRDRRQLEAWVLAAGGDRLASLS